MGTVGHASWCFDHQHTDGACVSAAIDTPIGGIWGELTDQGPVIVLDRHRAPALTLTEATATQAALAQLTKIVSPEGTIP